MWKYHLAVSHYTRHYCTIGRDAVLSRILATRTTGTLPMRQSCTDCSVRELCWSRLITRAAGVFRERRAECWMTQCCRPAFSSVADRNSTQRHTSCNANIHTHTQMSSRWLSPWQRSLSYMADSLRRVSRLLTEVRSVGMATWYVGKSMGPIVLKICHRKGDIEMGNE